MFLCFILSGTKKTYAGESGKEVSEVFQLTLYADDVEELFAYNEDDAEAYDADVNVAVPEETDQEGKWFFYGLICFWCFLKVLLL